MPSSSPQDMPPILVLAGGKATRLGSLTQARPKYLMPVSDQQCFADVHLQWLAAQGFKKVILAIGHLGEQIRDFCSNGSKWNLNIEYLEDGKTLVGTGGAVKRALEFPFEELCITYGDTLLNFSVKSFLAQFRSIPSLGSMTIYKNDLVGHTCNIDFRDPWIIYDKQKPAKNWGYIDYGFLVLKRELISGFSDTVPFDLAEPLSKASYEKKILGFLVQERFWEIGCPLALAQFQANKSR